MDFLYYLIISPIETVVDWIFVFISIKAKFAGAIGAVFGVSMAINFLALPLYNIADSLQEKERKITKSLEPMVQRIKKTFKGDERFMMLQAYYKLQNYHPIFVLRSSLSILIEIPFFIAAYHYLSHNELLNNARFWIFSDLGAPDTFFELFGFQIHILPIIMTMINIVSGAIYTKNAPRKEKIQLYAIALVFLALLYNSPSGLVIYWILNNLFSLAKNIVMKTKSPKKILHAVLSAIFILVAVYFSFFSEQIWKKAAIILFTAGFVLFPLAVRFLSKKTTAFSLPEKTNYEPKSNFMLLISSGMGLMLLCGFLLPASVIATSPIEFSFLGETASPLSYIFSTFFVYAGFFLFWPIALYKMFAQKIRFVLPKLLFAIFIGALLNAYVFRGNFGELNVLFEIRTSFFLTQIPKWHYIFSALSYIAILALVFFCANPRWQKIFASIAFSICLAECASGFIKTAKIKSEFNQYAAAHEKNAAQTMTAVYNLSKTQKNVVILFLDKAISSFFPYFMEQFPEMSESYAGFTFYPNCLSFGCHTAHGFPALAGGYEYTQEKINERENELLVDKHNEALLVMPKLFLDAGFEVTFTDPPESNYKVAGDYTPFAKFPEIKVSQQYGKYYEQFRQESKDNTSLQMDIKCRKNIRNFMLLQVLPPAARDTFNGFTLKKNTTFRFEYFEKAFSGLYYLPELTDFSSQSNTFTFIANDTCHDAISLDYPDYKVPSPLDKRSLGAYKPYSDGEAEAYNTNIAAFRQIAKWLDYLKKNGCYDNTRIIIASDHGYSQHYPPFVGFADPTIPSNFNCLLLVKDFSASGSVRTDNKFMTNADAVFFAKDNLPVADENPFTKKKFVQEKDTVTVYQAGFDGEWNVSNLANRKKFVLEKEKGFKVSENIFDEKNWIPLSKSQEEKK